MENEYISVKEFAEKAGISVQAVYKGLNNRLNQYVKTVDNQKMLDIRALQDIYGIEVEQPIQPKLTTKSAQNSTSDTLVDTLLMQIQTQCTIGRKSSTLRPTTAASGNGEKNTSS